MKGADQVLARLQIDARSCRRPTRRPSPAAWWGRSRTGCRAGRRRRRIPHDRWRRRRPARRWRRAGRSPGGPATRGCARPPTAICSASPARSSNCATPGRRAASAADSGPRAGQRRHAAVDQQGHARSSRHRTRAASVSATASGPSSPRRTSYRRGPSSTGMATVTRSPGAATARPGRLASWAAISSTICGRRARRPFRPESGPARRTARARPAGAAAAAAGSAAPSSSGRPEARPARRTASPGETASATTRPAPSIRARFSSRQAAPPPVARTVRRSAAADRSASVSRLAEGRLAFAREDLGMGIPAARDDAVVQVGERPAQAGRQQAADGGLAGPHEPDQEDRRVRIGRARHRRDPTRSAPNCGFFAPAPVRGFTRAHERRGRARHVAVQRLRCVGERAAARPLLGLLHPLGRDPPGGARGRLHHLRRKAARAAEAGRDLAAEPAVLPRLRRGGDAAAGPAAHRRGAAARAAPRPARRRSPHRRQVGSPHLPARAPGGRAARSLARRLRGHRPAHQARRAADGRGRAGAGRQRHRAR